MDYEYKNILLNEEDGGAEKLEEGFEENKENDETEEEEEEEEEEEKE